MHSSLLLTRARVPLLDAPIRSEVMAVDQFLQLSKRAPLDIKRSRFLPPKLGESGFGSVEVEYSVPILRQSVEP